MKFDLERKGYNKAQVDGHLKQVTLQYENSLAEQKDRIFELKGSISMAEKLLDEYKKKESEINSALLAAVNKAKEMEDAAEKKYDLEIQRLKLFNAKWQSYFNEIIKRYPVDDNLVSVAAFTSEMAGILSGKTSDAGRPHDAQKAEEKTLKAKPSKEKAQDKTPAPVLKPSDVKAQFEAEKRRLQEITPADPVGSINTYFQNQEKADAAKKGSAAGDAPAKSGGFDINEALHPDQDIAEILRDLGIFGEK